MIGYQKGACITEKQKTKLKDPLLFILHYF
uniref:Uncharacterized protein n=1 Tax=Moniliophthora roreri TaxID=221103 RepID=A0A0W0FNP7_MONRR